MDDLFMIECTNANLFNALADELLECNIAYIRNTQFQYRAYPVTTAFIEAFKSQYSRLKATYTSIIFIDGHSIALAYEGITGNFYISYHYFRDFIHNGHDFLLEYFDF